MMNFSSKIFYNKKILIYGIGKSGLSSYFFLKKIIILICTMTTKKFLKINLLKKFF